MTDVALVHGHALRIPATFTLIDSRPLAILCAKGKPVFLTIHPPTWEEPQAWIASATLDGPVLEQRVERGRIILRLARLRRVVAFAHGPLGALPIALSAPDARHDDILDELLASVSASPSDPSAVWVD